MRKAGGACRLCRKPVAGVTLLLFVPSGTKGDRIRGVGSLEHSFLRLRETVDKPNGAGFLRMPVNRRRGIGCFQLAYVGSQPITGRWMMFTALVSRFALHRPFHE